MRPTTPIPFPTPAERRRFDAKYDTPDEGCWTWLAAKADGYGRFRMRGKTWRAHRLLFAWTYPEIDIDGWELDHVACDNPGCVRPNHLQRSTTKQNVLRGRSDSAQNARKTHCSRGHRFSSRNTFIDSRGRRNCRKCWRIRKRDEHARRSNEIAARRRAAYKIKTWDDRQCKTCGETFTPITYNNRYCSPRCQENRPR